MKFTDSHEWIQVHGNIGVVGITKYAQKELGEIVFVELPKLGVIVEREEEVAVLESTKAAADIYAPVSGKVTKVNEQLQNDVHLINQSPEDQGWIFEIELSNPKEVEGLLSLEEYESMVSQEEA